ncbi:homospermidine synthase [Rhodoferax lacus]|uniref:Homospermidine synthase n=1 Tax=Rhodoferax lacus TaxID=2184758 RepID=A0A3E1R5V5_9BURK|nr:saccharopine dehydrogenase NADP-binding domain-containing protein [Rhodoferax lacus]RFO94667.1 homospermidine synthase [Rhodoferax lacus]
MTYAVEFRHRLMVLGFGCVAQGVLPLLLRHLVIRPKQILIITPHATHKALADSYGVDLMPCAVTPENMQATLAHQLQAGDFLLNLSVGVSSLALIALCRERGVLYLDTCIEPWGGQFTDASLPLASRTNQAQREAALALRSPRRDAPTAIIAHGAKPGLVSHFLKQALIHLAQDADMELEGPTTQMAWAHLAAMLNVRAIHIAEHDTQSGNYRRRMGECVNTWSANALVEEACQPSELGWGSHERHLPADCQQPVSGRVDSLYLRRPGVSTQVRSWTPLCGPMHGYLFTHAESISIADYLTYTPDGSELYRPTVLYAYHPCDSAWMSLQELVQNQMRHPVSSHILGDDIDAGADALGVLLMGPGHKAYWYGSQLSIAQARAACPNNNATTLQVACSVTAGVVWAIKNPARDIVEPDELPFEGMLDFCKPYLGDVGGVYTDWTPLQGRGQLFPEAVDTSDPWQFGNFRVI